MTDNAPRHPGTTHLLQFFTYDHLPVDLQEVSRPCSELAWLMAEQLPDGPELTAGLRRLLEAKDCFVRAQLLASRTGAAEARSAEVKRLTQG